MILKYLAYIIIIVIIFIFYCHIHHLYKINNNIEIQQSENPDEDTIHKLFIQKQPTIFKDIMFYWEPVDDIHKLSEIEIDDIIKNNKSFVEIIQHYLSEFSLLFSYSWDFSISERYITLDNQNNFYQQSHHRHLICQITGEQTIYIASPNQEKNLKPFEKVKLFNGKRKKQIPHKKALGNWNSDGDFDKKLINLRRSKVNFWDKNQTNQVPFKNLQYIEIILREGNILYIPYGWWYLQKVNENGLVMECVNRSILG